jgi:hypothetical protein
VTPLHVVTTPSLSLSHRCHSLSFFVFFVECIDPNRRRPNKKPPGLSAQEVASERDVAFAVR